MEADFKEKTWSLQKKIHSSFFIFFPIKTCWWTLCWCNPCLFIYNSCLTFITFVYLCHFQRNAPAVGFLYPQNNGFNSFGDKNMDIFPMTWSFPTLRWKSWRTEDPQFLGSQQATVAWRKQGSQDGDCGYNMFMLCLVGWNGWNRESSYGWNGWVESTNQNTAKIRLELVMSFNFPPF